MSETPENHDSDPDYGEFAGTPSLVRVVGAGYIMVFNENRVACWKGKMGGTLMRSMSFARDALRSKGYAIADFPDESGFYPVTPDPLGRAVTFAQTLEAIVEDASQVRPSGAYLALPKALPDAQHCPAELPPGARVAVPLLAAALPCAEAGDQIDVNRHHLAWAAWSWFVANKDAMAPLFAPAKHAQPARKKGR